MPNIQITNSQREIIQKIWSEPNSFTEGERLSAIEKSLGKPVWFTRGWCRLHFGAHGGREIIREARPPEQIRKENMRRWPMQRKATGAAINPGMNYLSDLIIRPGIQKYFRPLLLYRGNMGYGHAHRLWNMAVLMMAAECETLADGFKILHNESFTQLCGPVHIPGRMTMAGFFGRLWNSPDVMRVMPGLTEYVKSLELGPCHLTPVELESDKQFVAPWRVSNHPDFDTQAERPENGIRNLFYPYIAHDPKRLDDGTKIVMLVNKLVPKYLPEGIRADACQELVVGLLSGDVPADKAHEWVAEYVRKIYRLHPNLGRQEFAGAMRAKSLDSRFQGHDGEQISYTERI